MALRFDPRATFCVTLCALTCAAPALADTSYFPYYETPRDAYQFEKANPPFENGAVAPLPPTAAPTNWQAPQKGFHDRDAGATMPSLLLGTRGGLDGGIQASYYRYNEPSPDVQLTGPQIGVIGAATFILPNRMFDTLDGRYAYGRVNYDTPEGSSDNHANEIWEIRDTVGQDFVWDHYALSPYVGLGYRNLYSDERGTTSEGFSGYQRESQYLYIPIGVKPQMRIDGANILNMNMEFDYLAQGWQTSHLGDAGGGDPTIHNSQGSGLGFRGEAMWETSTWAIGPFINYWNIGNSANKVFSTPNITTCGAATCVGQEPHNITIEGGIQLKYHFLSF